MKEEIQEGDYVIVEVCLNKKRKYKHLGIVRKVHANICGYDVDLLTMGKRYFPAHQVRKATKEEIEKIIP